MANEFIKSTKIKPAILGNIADPDQYNQNIGGQSKGAVVCIDSNGEFVDGDVGDESLNSTGALINNIKLRQGGSLKIYNSAGVLISQLSFEQERGIISAFAMSSPPAGWLECNGSAISRTLYASLFNLIGTAFGIGNGSTTFNIPDLRGDFVRGWDHGRGVDSGRGFGSRQLDALQNITAGINMIGNSKTAQIVGTGAFLFTSTSGSDFAGGGGYANTNGPLTFDASRVARTSAETRPTNSALLYCIKY